MPTQPNADRPTRAMVLAAGLGVRMRPLTNDRPKPMVPLAGRPLIDHVLDRLAAAGIATAVVNLHYKPGVLRAHLAKRKRPHVVFSDETDALLDTGGGVAKALSLLAGGPFLIHNSDTVWTEGIGANLTRLIEAWDPARMDSLLLLAPTVRSLGYDGRGDFAMDTLGHLRRRQPKEVVPYAFAGVSIATAKLFDGAPAGAFSLNLLWDRAIAANRLFGVRMDGTWMHVGDPAALAVAEAHLAREVRR